MAHYIVFIHVTWHGSGWTNMTSVHAANKAEAEAKAVALAEQDYGELDDYMIMEIEEVA